MNRNVQTATFAPSIGLHAFEAMALMPRTAAAAPRGRIAGVTTHAPPDPA